MTIKHLVLAGGGVSGLAGIGTIHTLFESNVLKIEEIKSIYGTSVGSMIGLFICFYKLGINNEIIKDYIIQRPFHETYKIHMNQILQIYDTKGIYDKSSAFILFDPFFKTIEMSKEITMKEFYNLTDIELYFYTIEINSFVLKELSHKNTPDLSVIEAIYMSSTIPFIMSPIIKNNDCYIDGGFLCNYPIQQCLKNESLKNESLKNESLKNNEILGIDYKYNSIEHTFVNEKTNVIDYIITILKNIIIIISNIGNTIVSKNDNLFCSEANGISYYEIFIPIKRNVTNFINAFFSQDERLIFYHLGTDKANEFYNAVFKNSIK
jgi:predicted patatin/cPLA2 family phospholipase